ncbi:CubicO group peptidase (beta-lactamase class C family) [Leeuwenhoekiella aestuarii]|uniref:serine hydrolase domain-containing protein n=1 Tax=Leeuwenhoekiella aestuarii TaxID=2249426 RepID=UPI000FFE83F3|nr:serine hydrolase domain-containing protein [Leeuwenhoekiella aestuarii]RXG12189.1 CubicO group peptidase (beta-lactamase class C family) [Leeuwenhoekiella aestuarii]
MGKTQYLISLFFIVINLKIYSQSFKRIDNSIVSTTALDNEIKRLKKSGNVHGLTVSIVTKDSILFQKAYGSRNLKEKQPLKTSHNFYAASLCKPLFAFIVMKLVDEGKIDLDKPLIEYLENPIYSYEFQRDYENYKDLKTDKRYKKITARMCLSHTTGFPNWRYIGKSGIDMKRPLEIEFEPGTFYNYSGEGIQLLQFVVEHITEKGLEELALEYVFQPLEMNMTSFLWQEKFDSNYAVGHYKKRKTLKRRKRNVEYAAGSMDTTPEDYAKFIQTMLAQKGLSKNAYNEFFKPQILIESKQQFGKNRLIKTSENNDIQLSYALGFGTYKTPYGKAIFKEGHIQGWEHYTVFYPSQNLGIVIMSNSSNGESVFKELVEISMGDKWMPWYWENFIPYDKKKY